MRPKLEIISRTQLPINYNQLQERINPDSYSPRRSIFTPQKEKPLVPLKQFQEYFGKTKPNFYQELKNIFAHAQIEDFSPSLSVEEPFCRIQGSILASRARSLKKRKEVGQSNNFTIEKTRGKEIYRKARLNKLIKMQWQLEDQSLQDEDATNIIRQSETIVQQLKDVMKIRRTITPAHHRHRNFRLSQSVDRQTLLFELNPDSKQIFTLPDLHRAIAVLHSITIRISPNINYFNVYIEEGNNAELLKMLVRKRAGWRVVEIPAIANFIWTQFYRKSAIKNRLNKRQKFPTDLESNLNKNMTFKAGRAQTKSIDSKIYSSLTPSGESNFTSEVCKLIPDAEAEDVRKIKMGWRKSFEEIYINHNVLVHNHFPQNRCITDKKNLLQHLRVYYSDKKLDVFQYLPQSYQLVDLEHPVIKDLEAKQKEKQRWIIKPGENSNRGRGIIVAQSNSETLQQLSKRFQTHEHQHPHKNPNRSVVLQKYLIPLLYNTRKFDIRSYMLVTYFNKQVKAYCYDQCYIRTSSKAFDIQSTNRLVHLTNDAVQTQSNDYGKFEEGNKVAEATFSRFIDEEYKKKMRKGSIWKELKKEMERRCIDVIEASYQTLVSGWKERLQQENDKRQFCFELFGMDFMIDQDFKLWLIEVNTNPAINHDCSKVLNLLIPKMLDNMLALAVEPIMRPQRVPETPFINRFKAVFKRSLS